MNFADIADYRFMMICTFFLLHLTHTRSPTHIQFTESLNGASFILAFAKYGKRSAMTVSSYNLKINKSQITMCKLKCVVITNECNKTGAIKRLSSKSLIFLGKLINNSRALFVAFFFHVFHTIFVFSHRTVAITLR